MQKLKEEEMYFSYFQFKGENLRNILVKLSKRKTLRRGIKQKRSRNLNIKKRIKPEA